MGDRGSTQSVPGAAGMSRTWSVRGTLRAARYPRLAPSLLRSRSVGVTTPRTNLRYVLKQKLLSRGDDYYTRDDQGREVYLVDGKAISFGRQLSFRDLEGIELAFIGPNDLEAKGDFFDHEYVFTRGDREVATASKRRFSWSDTYGVDVQEGEDDVLILVSAVVVD